MHPPRARCPDDVSHTRRACRSLDPWVNLAAVAETVSYPGAHAPTGRGRCCPTGSASPCTSGRSRRPTRGAGPRGPDFARTFDVFAPLLADAGWRVVSWDQRGHGDSQHAALYSWDADLRDAVAVVDSVTTGALPVVGHLKGGGVMVQFAAAAPPGRLAGGSSTACPAAGRCRTCPTTSAPSCWRASWAAGSTSAVLVDASAGPTPSTAGRAAGPHEPPPVPGLAPLPGVGGRLRDDDGWRWKIDPSLRLGGFGPWRPEWAMSRLPGLGSPLLAVLAMQPEMMGWATTPDEVEPYLPPCSDLVVLDDVGHFVHIEQPERVARLVLDFLGDPR